MVVAHDGTVCPRWPQEKYGTVCIVIRRAPVVQDIAPPSCKNEKMSRGRELCTIFTPVGFRRQRHTPPPSHPSEKCHLPRLSEGKLHHENHGWVHEELWEEARRCQPG